MITVKIWSIGIYPCFYSIIWTPYIFHMKVPRSKQFLPRDMRQRGLCCRPSVRPSVTLVGLWEDIISGTERNGTERQNAL